MPLAPAAQHIDPAWQGVLDRLLDDLATSNVVPAPLHPTLAALRATPATERDRLAQAVLAEAVSAADLPHALFVTAALQVVFIDRACRLQEDEVPLTDTPSLCPVCASKPVAGIVRIGGAYGGLRYLHCGLCATEWHMVRVKCSHCASTEAIRYESVEGGPAHVQAETCGACHCYRKLIQQDKDPLAEPLADDLASLVLDLLMGETAFTRASANPFMPYAIDTPATSPEGSADA
ncbi:MAG: Protein FdhE [Paracidovorax wautersii]|uniref:Protein FdhE n=1 Tax=Paracidovorax wautersii TaxID=1177982 RepID=A0A7V8FRT8_9BURK|nr:MAG: Protein FdhE [Paracidovorax wautersii]